MSNANVFKTLKIIGRVVTWVLVAVTVFMMAFTIVSVNFFDNDDRSVLGYKAFIVTSGSMAATDFAEGDLILVKEVDVDALEVGDIITFQSQDPKLAGQRVTHKIRSINYDDKGNKTFTTYGTTTDSNDPVEVSPAFVHGKYVGKIAGAGTFFGFLKTPPGYVLCILLPFLLLIGVQGVNVFRLFRKYKQEQTADLDEERRKLAAEREESQRLMAELRAMKEELEREREAGGASGSAQKNDEN